MKRNVITAIILAGALALSLPAFADHDHGHGHGKGNPHERQDDNGWERHGNYESHVFEGDSRPPGWSKGRKTGWGNCGLPPGQAKKYGCQTYTYQGQPYYYYHDDQGRIVVRRPAIHIEGSVDIP
ncbi:MAG TPA: hypothetical protein VKW78_14565 [Terriglobales bacterium]|jgi:hypothetical protein|nr:hypothetical protein [Terriglobales bacterium]